MTPRVVLPAVVVVGLAVAGPELAPTPPPYPAAVVRIQQIVTDAVCRASDGPQFRCWLDRAG